MNSKDHWDLDGEFIARAQGIDIPIVFIETPVIKFVYRPQDRMWVPLRGWALFSIETRLCRKNSRTCDDDVVE